MLASEAEASKHMADNTQRGRRDAIGTDRCLSLCTANTYSARHSKLTGLRLEREGNQSSGSNRRRCDEFLHGVSPSLQ
jgi:hypothetical protein